MATATLAGACIIGPDLTGFAALDAAETNAVDAVAAVQQAAPDAVSDVATLVKAHSAAAVQAKDPEGGTVQIPKDASDGVQVITPGAAPDVTIGLPFADQASEAAASQEDGVVAFDNNNGSSTVPVAHSDGGVQISTVIEHAKAPKRYDYPIGVPDGATIEQSPNGVVAIVTADGSPLRVFGGAWAKDANGNPVPTHYEVHGTTLTQVVDFTEHTEFPVVADPTTTGVYSYNCILQNGSSYFIAPGALLGNCKGSYLKKYINGTMVQSIPLTGYGKPANPAAFGTWECLVSLAWASFSIYGPGKFVKFASGAFGYVLAQAIPTNITSCRG
jgi:hypothetical protein